MSARVAMIILLMASLFGCQTTSGEGTKQGVGTILGGVAGAVAGSQMGKGSGRVAAGAAGALLGAFLGNQIGLSLDRADRLAMQKTTTVALETSKSGRAVSWRNPDTGNRGTVTPRPAFKNNRGLYCREFQQTVTIGGKVAEAYGTACRQVDGSWKIVR
ncbi:MAG: hypothetical protein CMM58_00230 [Rhodospirillaceae bacterium]|nr:hypothetical protein [Rhodospirillaceae bacterium]|tara:strand:+ start:83 stop:559 length:477 start_codon:yes stop_codon:yes gene_type:complete